jgi:hypothetical protein
MLRYYPSFKVITNLNSKPSEFSTPDRLGYTGKYYLTYDGRAFSGISPSLGPGIPLKRNFVNEESSRVLTSLGLSTKQKQELTQRESTRASRVKGKPNSYFPQLNESDYTKGYVIRYFTKKENDNGFIIEISDEEYNSIVNGTADYDIRMYQVTKILWKLTGPLRSTRQSQYNIIPGIIDTNQRLTEAANKNFLGIVEFIGGDYTKFARPTM